MKRIQLQIKALSPLAIARQKPGGSVSEAVDYIPGSVIRGAVAATILQQSGHRSTKLVENGGDFQALFLDTESAIFQNAYPAVLIIENTIVIQNDIKVLPATALSSKTKSGFKSSNNNGVFDTLIDRLCAKGYGYPYDPNCPTDGERVDSVSSIKLYSQINDEYHKHSVAKRLLTRTAINRRRATVEEEILYSIEVHNESESTGKNPKPVIYSSAILVTDTLAKSLQQFIHNHSQEFRLGGSTSRGLGKVEINPKKPVDIRQNLKEKIAKFNDTLGRRWNEWQVFGNPLKDVLSNRTYFTLDLQADAILTDQWQSTTVISAEMLQLFTGVEDASTLKLEAAYSSYDYCSGWNAAWGLMKDVEMVTNKGAVYLFSTTQPDLWYEALSELELKGVGDRTCEGFGQVEVCNEFHLVFREYLV